MHQPNAFQFAVKLLTHVWRMSETPSDGAWQG